MGIRVLSEGNLGTNAKMWDYRGLKTNFGTRYIRKLYFFFYFGGTSHVHFLASSAPIHIEEWEYCIGLCECVQQTLTFELHDLALCY